MVFTDEAQSSPQSFLLEPFTTMFMEHRVCFHLSNNLKKKCIKQEYLTQDVMLFGIRAYVEARMSDSACCVFLEPRIPRVSGLSASRAQSVNPEFCVTLLSPFLRREQRRLQPESPSPWPPWWNRPTSRSQPDRGWAPRIALGCPLWSRACVLSPSRRRGDSPPSGSRCSTTRRRSSRYR